MALTQIKSEGIKDSEVKNADMADDAVGVAELSATGTPSNTTYLRGDNTWTVPPDTNTTVGGSTGVDFNDNVKARFGTGNDLEIYHNGTSSKITNSTGYLYIEGTTQIWNAAGSEAIAKFTENGAVELYYDNVKQFYTQSGGSRFVGRAEFDGGIRLTDTREIQFGDPDGGDLKIFHDGTGCNIRSTSAKLEIRSDSLNLQSSAAEKYLVGEADGGVHLYYDNSKRIHTTSDGCVVQGTEGAGGVLQMWADEGDDNADKWRLSASASASELYFQNYKLGSWATNMKLVGDDQVEIFYKGSKKIETTTYGQRTTGYATSSAHPIASLSHNGDVDISDDVLDSGNFYGYEMVNQGSHFDDSNGRFTCPVAGVYRVFARFTIDSEDTNVRLRKNGTAVAEVYSGDISTQSFSTSGEIVVSCAANDYLDLQAHRLKAISGTQHKQVTFQLIA